MYCGEQTLVKYEQHERLAVSLRCRAWTCPDCAPIRQKGLAAQAIAGNPNKFLTLTSKRRDGITPGQAARELAKAWRLLRLRLMRRYKIDRLPFLAVFQATKTGWPHLHILLRGPWLDQTYISQVMAELASSPIVDIRAVESAGRVAVYVSRYVTRNSERFETCKRYWCSQDYDERPEDKEDNGKVLLDAKHGEVERNNIRWIVRMWEGFEWHVRWLDPRRAICTIPP